MLGFQKCKHGGWVTVVILFASAALTARVTLARSTVNSAMAISASTVGSKPVVVPTNSRLPAVIISIRSTRLDPKELNSLSGRCLRAIDTQNGLGEMIVRRGVERLPWYTSD